MNKKLKYIFLSIFIILLWLTYVLTGKNENYSKEYYYKIYDVIWDSRQCYDFSKERDKDLYKNKLELLKYYEEIIICFKNMEWAMNLNKPPFMYRNLRRYFYTHKKWLEKTIKWYWTLVRWIKDWKLELEKKWNKIIRKWDENFSKAIFILSDKYIIH